MDLFGIVILGFIGIATGVIISLLGVSGSILVVPLLILAFSTSIHTAIGTSLFNDMIGASVVAVSYYREERVDLNASLLLIISALIGSQLGVLIAESTGEASLSILVSLVFIGIGLLTLQNGIKKTKKKETGEEPQKINFKSEWHKRGLIIIIGLFIGLMSGLFGAGGGLMILVVLLVIFKYPIHIAIGTATAIMSIIALSGTIGYSLHGDINLEYGLILGLGSILGGRLGSLYANKLSETRLTILMGLVFILVGSITFVLVSIL